MRGAKEESYEPYKRTVSAILTNATMQMGG